MDKAPILVAHHPDMPMGMAEIHEVEGVGELGTVTMTEDMILRFITESIGEDLFAIGIINMIVANGKQAMIIKNPEQEIPGL